MSELFLKIVNMSISASWLILAVLGLRLVLKKAPKWVNILLWGIVAVRLLLPVSIESVFSLIPSAETVPVNIGMAAAPAINSGIDAINDLVNPVLGQVNGPASGAGVNPLQITVAVCANIWLLGAAVLLVYGAIRYWRLRRKVETAVFLRENIFLCEAVASPFVMGIIRPRIYLPFRMENQALAYVVAHEQAHIRRRDHWWKPLGFLLVTVHWFNPLVWIADALLCRDIELACDEKVIRELNNEDRANYTQSLVACSMQHRMFAVSPLAFGEIGVKERVKSIMNYQKPGLWTNILAVSSCVVVVVCFLTNPVAAAEVLEPMNKPPMTYWEAAPSSPKYPTGEKILEAGVRRHIAAMEAEIDALEERLERALERYESVDVRDKLPLERNIEHLRDEISRLEARCQASRKQIGEN